MTLRILMLLNEFPSAYQTFIARQIDGLLRRGHEVHVVSKVSILEPCAARAAYPFLAWDRLEGRVHPLSTTSSRWQRASVPLRAIARRPGTLGPWLRQLATHHDVASVYGAAVAEVVGGHRFDVIHAQFGPLGNVALAAKAAGLGPVPVVTAFRGSDATSHLRKHPRVYDRLKHEGAAFLPVSSNLRDVLVREGFSESHIDIIPSPLAVAEVPFRPAGRLAPPLRLAAVGRLVEKKGFEDGIHALALLVSRGVDLGLDLYGDGPLHDELLALAKRLGVAGRVTLHGRVPPARAQQAMATAVALLVPSVTASDGDEEGVPNVVKEAMALGTPVVATRHGGIEDLVTDGASGWLVPERDATALADAVEEVLADGARRHRVVVRARQDLMGRYDVSAVTDRLEAVYRRLVP